jgi:hypothetical protein
VIRDRIKDYEKDLNAAKMALEDHNYEVDTSEVPWYIEAQGGERRTLKECADLQTEEWRNVEKRLLDAIHLAETKLSSARSDLARSEEFREWRIIVDGFESGTTLAPSSSEALKVAITNVDRSDYPNVETTMWISVKVICDESGEEDLDTVALHPDIPGCVDGINHDWQSPLKVVGGSENHPGMWPNGAGVIIREVCGNCGKYKVTNTWAMDMATGAHGLRSVSYEKPDNISLQWLADKR